MRGTGRYFLLLAMVSCCGRARAEPPPADPTLPYQVAFTGGSASVQNNLRSVSTLVSLRSKAPVDAFALIIRAQTDAARLSGALHDLGYQAGKVSLSINGASPDDAGLPMLLAQQNQAKVAILVAPGPLYHVSAIRIEGDTPAGAAQAIAPLAAGSVADAADVVEARARLLDRLRQTGHALASIDPATAIADDPAATLEIIFKVNAGPVVQLGPISITGLKRVHESFVRRRLEVMQGRRFDPDKIEQARQDLASLGVFTSVTAVAATRLDAAGQLPLRFTVAERPRHAVELTAAYATDLGGSLGVTWTDRDVFHGAESLKLHAAVTDLGGSATNGLGYVTGLGYDAGADYTIPDWRRRDQDLSIGADALREYLEAYDRTGFTEHVTVTRQLAPHWQLAVGVATLQERVTQHGTTGDYETLGTPVTLSFDNSNSVLDPSRGLRASMNITPTLAFGRQIAPYVTLDARASTYFDFGTDGNSVLALRGQIGTTDGASLLNLPPDARFYAGGSPTVRGYAYQSIGPRFSNGDPVGGLALDAGTVELRQHVWGRYGVALFMDAGQVSTAGLPFVGALQEGAGAGLRVATPIGPIRVDAAVPVNPRPGDASLEFYIGLGQAF